MQKIEGITEVIVSEFSGYNHGSNIGGNADIPDLTGYTILDKWIIDTQGGTLTEYKVRVPAGSIFIGKNRFNEKILAIPGKTTGNIATSPYRQKDDSKKYIQIDYLCINEKRIHPSEMLGYLEEWYECPKCGLEYCYFEDASKKKFQENANDYSCPVCKVELNIL